MRSNPSKTELYGRCSRTVQLNFAMYSVVAKVVWSMALLCCKRKVSISGLTLEIQTFNLASICLQLSEVAVPPGSRTSKQSHPAYMKGLSFLSLLNRTTHGLTVLTSTVLSPYTFNKYRWMSLGAICSAVRYSITPLCFFCTLSYTILVDCRTTTKLTGH